MVVSFDFNPGSIHQDEGHLVVVSNDKRAFLLDVKKKKKIELVSDANYARINHIKFVDDCLYLLFHDFSSKKSGYELYSFDFSKGK